MPIIFAKAPLLEIIAEVRWATNTLPRTADQLHTPAGPLSLPFVLGDAKTEEFFMRLGGAVYQLGFQQSERLVPPGFPTVPGQAVFRYRSTKPPANSVLYQVGPGIFSVNGIRPYRSWEDFAPLVRNGVEALLKSRNEPDADSPFTQITLRYIDLFSEELIQGLNVDSFISGVLGISVGLPSSLREVASDKMRSLSVKLVLPVAIGNLTLSVSDGKANDQAGIIMDTSVSSAREAASDVDSIMRMLDSAHGITNRVFLDMTKPLGKLMQPEGEEVREI